MDTGAVITIAVTVSLALAGYLLTYYSNLRLARRKDRLERVNRQLTDLYGPLFALTHAGERIWSVVKPRLFPPQPGMLMTEAHADEWRLWILHVFMPLNRQMMEAIVEHADLLREPTMPPPLQDLCAHVAGYEPVLVRWASDDFDSLRAEDHKSVIGFPHAALREYVDTAFTALKSEQAKLLAEVERR
jgi:hypothetical protein